MDFSKISNYVYSLLIILFIAYTIYANYTHNEENLKLEEKDFSYDFYDDLNVIKDMFEDSNKIYVFATLTNQNKDRLNDTLTYYIQILSYKKHPYGLYSYINNECNIFDTQKEMYGTYPKILCDRAKYEDGLKIYLNENPNIHRSRMFIEENKIVLESKSSTLTDSRLILSIIYDDLLSIEYNISKYLTDLGRKINTV